jgi:hypothetical protein
MRNADFFRFHGTHLRTDVIELSRDSLSGVVYLFHYLVGLDGKLLTIRANIDDTKDGDANVPFANIVNS